MLDLDPDLREIENAVALSDFYDLVEDLGGSVDETGLITFPRECDLDAFCELLEEEGARVNDIR